MSTDAPPPIANPTRVDYVALPAGSLIGRYEVASVLGRVDSASREAAGCTTNAASASGRVAGSALTLDLRGADVSYRGALSSHAGRSPGTPTPPSGLRTDMP